MASNKTVVYAALVGNSIIAVAKFVAASFTGSSAMVSEGIHSVVDSFNQVLLLYGMKASQRPPDERHPFGYSAEIYFWAFVVAILIFAVGSGLSIYEGYHKIIDPHEITNVWVNYVVLIFALIVESIAWYFAFRAIERKRGDMGYVKAVRHSKDPAIFTVLLEDTAACLGLLIALIGVFLADIFDMPVFDGIASLAIGVLLALVAVFLAYETKALLIGEAAAPKVVKGIRDAIRNESRIERCIEMNTMHLGPNHVIVDILAEFNDKMTTADIEGAIVDLERDIKSRFSSVQNISVEPATGRAASASTS